MDKIVNLFNLENFRNSENIVPYQRFWNSQYGAKTSSFVKTASYKKGFASSDNVIYQ